MPDIYMLVVDMEIHNTRVFTCHGNNKVKTQGKKHIGNIRLQLLGISVQKFQVYYMRAD